MLTRAIVVLVMLAGAGAYASSATRPEHVVSRATLADFPLMLDAWRGYAAAPLADDVVAELGVDDYINRRYVRPGGTPVSLYVGYYASQRQGDTIHSPQNCLPGAGWQALDSGRVTLASPGGPAEVNRYLIGKGLDRQMVLYWYQGRNRIIASEYTNKFFLMVDAARQHRTSGGLVRLITPVGDNVDRAVSELTAFAGALLAQLGAYVP